MSTARGSEVIDLIENSDVDGIEEVVKLVSSIAEGSERSNEDDLEPITPEKAVKRYCSRRRNQLADSSMYTHKSSLDHFIKWCKNEDIENMNNLTGRDMQDYLDWRVEEAPRSVDRLAKKSEKTQIDITRKFIEICETFDAVKSDLHTKILPFRISKVDEVREATLSKDRMDEIINYLEKYEYASREHVVWILLREFGPRIGTLRALDVRDILLEEECIKLRHRPENDTPLKNDQESERKIGITENTVEVIRSYLNKQRIDSTDDYGREPLLSTNHGRIAGSTIRRYVYKLSCPTNIGKNCSCDHCAEDQTDGNPSKCLNSVSPHPVRRGAITHFLRQEIPKHMISDRCDVSPRVIDLHYDARSEQERMETRRSRFAEAQNE